jgi:hypothetical protein
VNWQPFSGLVLRADYGVPFISTSDSDSEALRRNRGTSLQDNGFNFSVRYQPF